MVFIVKNSNRPITLLRVFPYKNSEFNRFHVTNGDTVTTIGLPKDGFQTIQLANGCDGWIQTKYLVSQSPTQIVKQDSTVSVGTLYLGSRPRASWTDARPMAIWPASRPSVDHTVSPPMFVWNSERTSVEHTVSRPSVEHTTSPPMFVWNSERPSVEHTVSRPSVEQTVSPQSANVGKVLHVLVQQRNKTSGFKLLMGLFGIPGGQREHGESSSDTVVRETREETGITLDPQQLRVVASGKKCDYLATIAPVSFGYIKDRGETEDASGMKLNWLRSVGAVRACHGHYWVPVRTFENSTYNACDFMTGIPSRILTGAKSLSQPLRQSGQRDVNGFALIYKMM
jgi:ADP-ribose pyrophosphatase YjhB (NUDIX family)